MSRSRAECKSNGVSSNNPLHGLIQFVAGRIGGTMTIDSLIAEIDTEIKRLQQARALLSSTDGVRSHANAAKKSTTGKKRTLSGAARKRIADAQRKRWAKQKAATK